MKNLALPRIRAMKPYEPPLDGRAAYGGLLLDFNERTEPSKAAIRALEQFARNKKVQLYPEYVGLPAKIAVYAGVKPGQVMVTNGTDQAIDVIFRTFIDAGDTVVVPEPTFAMYGQYAQTIGARIVSPLYEKGTLAFPLQEVCKLLAKKPKLLVVTNPNSPTGGLLPAEEVAKLAELAPDTVVYVDEAYFEFAQVTAAGLIRDYPNIIVSRTFSKAFGLAGLRIGYVLADERYIAEMLKVRGPYDVNEVACCAAIAVLDNQDEMRRYVGEVMGEAKPFVEWFFRQNNIPYCPSAGNFILFRPDDAAGVAATLQKSGIRVRPQDKPNIDGSLRLTIGTFDQMRLFADTYQRKVLGRRPRKYAFIDRDGTLIFEPQDTFQIDSLEKLRILDGAVEGLRALAEQGYTLVLVSNQDGLGTPSFPQEDFDAPQQAMLKVFRAAGIEFARICICPHKPEDSCNCHKPKTGLLDDLLRDEPADFTNSLVCGDRASDAALAKNLGVRFVPMQLNGNFYNAVKRVL